MSITIFLVAGPPPAGGIGHLVLYVLHGVAGFALYMVAFALALMPVSLYAEKRRDAQAMPRPRWQYLAIAGCWAFLAAALALASAHTGAGWLARATGTAAVWLAAFCLAMLGRAATWGRVRDLFWWYRPRWVRDDAVTWLTPPRAPVAQGRKRLGDG